MNLKDLKQKSPTELLTKAEELNIEDASSMRKQDLMFAILKKTVGEDEAITGEGTIEVMQDGFGFLRSSESNYLAGPDDIYVSPAQVKRYGLRTGDTVEGEIRAPKENEKYFALVNVNKINFDEPEKSKLRVNFDNLTPLYPTEKLNFEDNVFFLEAFLKAERVGIIRDPLVCYKFFSLTSGILFNTSLNDSI